MAERFSPLRGRPVSLLTHVLLLVPQKSQNTIVGGTMGNTQGIRVVLAVVTILYCLHAPNIDAQTTPGILPFDSAEQHEYDHISLADLGIFVNIPIRNKNGSTP